MKVLKPVLTIALLLVSFVCFVFGWFIKLDLGDEWDGGLGAVSDAIDEVVSMTEELEYEIESYDEAEPDDELEAYTVAAAKLKEPAKKMSSFIQSIESGRVSLWDMHRVTFGMNKIISWYGDAFDYNDDEDFQLVKLIFTIVMIVFIVIPAFGALELIISLIRIFKNKEKAANNFRRHAIVMFILAALLSYLPLISEDFRDSDMSMSIGIPYVIMLVTAVAAAVFWNSVTKKEKKSGTAELKGE